MKQTPQILSFVTIGKHGRFTSTIFDKSKNGEFVAQGEGTTAHNAEYLAYHRGLSIGRINQIHRFSDGLSTTPMLLHL